MSSTLGAVLLDLRPRGSLAPLLSSNAPNAGLALGVLLTAVLVQYGPAPTQLVWWLLLGVFAAALVLVAVMPGTFVSRGSSRTGPPAQSTAAGSDVCPVPCTVPPHVPSAHQEAGPAKVPR
jgi:hypothetical protein